MPHSTATVGPASRRQQMSAVEVANPHLRLAKNWIEADIYLLADRVIG